MDSKPSTSYERLGRVTTQSVFKCTGKHWHEWIAILDKAGARSWTHQEIVAFLKKKYKLGPWWQQGVTSGFELAIGRRIEGQNAKGEYSLTATKSLPLGALKVWNLLLSKEGQAAWLKPLYPVTLAPGHAFETSDGFFGEVRTMKKAQRIRMTWQDPNWEKKTVLQIHLVPRPNDKSLLAFTHDEIKHLKTQSLLRARWKTATDAVLQLIKEAF